MCDLNTYIYHCIPTKLLVNSRIYGGGMLQVSKLTASHFGHCLQTSLPGPPPPNITFQALTDMKLKLGHESCPRSRKVK